MRKLYSLVTVLGLCAWTVGCAPEATTPSAPAAPAVDHEAGMPEHEAAPAEEAPPAEAGSTTEEAAPAEEKPAEAAPAEEKPAEAN